MRQFRTVSVPQKTSSFGVGLGHRPNDNSFSDSDFDETLTTCHFNYFDLKIILKTSLGSANWQKWEVGFWRNA